MKHNEFSEIEEVTGEILKEKLMELLEDGAGSSGGTLPICWVTLPDGTFARLGVFYHTPDSIVKIETAL